MRTAAALRFFVVSRLPNNNNDNLYITRMSKLYYKIKYEYSIRQSHVISLKLIITRRVDRHF